MRFSSIISLTPEKAKKYSSIKYSLSLIETAFLLVLLFAFQISNASSGLADFLSAKIAPRVLSLASYILIVIAVYRLLNFPLNFYASFRNEKRFGLSNQAFTGWLKDQLKAYIISFIVILILAQTFFSLFSLFPRDWWFYVASAWVLLSFFFSTIMPVVIIPLFFTYKKMDNDGLKSRIISLAGRMGIKLLNVFEIDFSRKTNKANAAFVGWGATKRVIIADTLKDRYTYEEIEAILAHEFAHYKLRHLLKLILLNSIFTFICLYVIFKTQGPVLRFFGLHTLNSVAALPLIFMYFTVFGLIFSPLQNFFSRIFERNADTLALQSTGLKDAFISMMEKLASQNLADSSPNPIIKFFFFDHPPIEERIKSAREFKGGPR